MSEDPEAPGVSPAKVDPQKMVLRGRIPKVVRFRRGVIVAIAALGSGAMVGVTWIALKPATLRIVAGAENANDVANVAPGDALAAAPRSYGDLPKLGPTLPGDLGRPILRHQQAMETPPTTPADPNVDAEAAARAEYAAQQKAARESGILLPLTGSSRSAASAPARNATAADAPDALLSQPAPAAGLISGPAASVKAPPVARANEDGDNLHRVAAPASPYTLAAGSIIAASLITGLDSDLPGLVAAQVTENVYDSVRGRFLLIPQGSRLIGRYDSGLAFGQKRALVVWQRLMLPDGASVALGDMPATDSQGYAGLADRVDVHGWQLLKGVALSTLLGVGTELSFGNDEGALVRAVRESAQQSGSRAGDQLVAKNLAIPPTVRVRPGWPVRVLVSKDLVLTPYATGGD